VIGVRVEIVDFSQVLQQSTSGRALGDEILAAVVRSGIIAASMVQRDVRAEANTLPSACHRWLVQPGNDDLVIGLSDEDAVAFTEVFFGAPATRIARPLAPVERRVLGTHLAVFLAPIAHAAERPIAPDVALVEGVEPPDDGDWIRFGVEFTIDNTTLSCTIAARELRAASISNPHLGAPVPPVRDIAVDVEFGLRNVRMAWGDIATLKVGDVVTCAVSEDQPIEGWVAHRRVFDGHLTATDDGFVYEILTTYLERVA
jgi:flagellar motor switch/type III secretory pathway protein FliN